MFCNRLTPFALVLASGVSAYAGIPLLSQSQLSTLKAQEGARTALAMQRLQGAGPSLGLSGDNAFRMERAGTDAFGILHVHVHQAYKGVSVWGGDAILHTDAENQPLPMTDKLIRGLNMSVTPALESSEALAIASRDMAPRGAFAYTPTSELVVVPRIQRTLRAGVAAAQANASDVISTVVGGDLAWHLHLDMQSQSDSRAMDYLISATNGAVLKKWSTRETVGTPAVGTGNSQYNGTVSIGTNMASASSYTMTDTLRGGTTVTDLANGTAGGTVYTDADNTWGDGNNYYDGTTAGGTSGVTGQTAAVDAKYGFEATWDYYKNVHGRNGIDGLGTATNLRMHYANSYDNAFWSDACFCMTFGDGSAPAPNGLKNLTAIDVIGHELSHGVIANSVAGGLNYYDESGGLNESDSDINGTFVTYYAYNGSTGSVVPNTIPGGSLHGYVPWQIGPQLSSPPLRYMYKPSKDGFSPDAWSFNIGQLNVHYSSGPMNRAMYFLAQGATTTSTDDTYSAYLPGGMTGIGNDKASKIWYRVMTTGLTSSSNYHDARIACEAAATALYGATELAAVQNAFHAINVGPVAGQPDDTQAPTGVTASESGTAGNITIGATAADDVGIANIDFSIDGAVMASISAAGTTLFDSHLLSNGSHSLIATAYDAYRNNTASSPLSFTTLNSYSQFLTDSGFEQGGVNWGFGGANAGVITTASANAHGGNNYAIVGAAGGSQSYGYQVFSIPAAATKPTLSFYMWVRTDTSAAKDTGESIQIQIYDSTLNTQLGTLATYYNNDPSVAGYQIKTLDMSAYKGQTIGLVIWVAEGSSGHYLGGRFDDFAVTNQWAVPDEDGDGKVDGIDLGLFAKDYGTAAPLSDLNNDGAVDGTDAPILLNAFGQ
jgi:Zn-dependent metalloprotease